MELELPYKNTVEGRKAHFGAKLEKLSFNMLAEHARAHYASLLARRGPETKYRVTRDKNAILAVKMTLQDFQQIAWSRKLRARLIVQSMGRSKKMRDPYFQELLETSKPAIFADYYFLAGLLLHRVKPDCKERLF